MVPLNLEEEAKRADLNEEIDDLRDQIASPALEVARLDEEEHTAYYAIGTEEELLRRGIVEKEGGAHVLFFLWKAGETLVPARNLDPSQFNSLDTRHTTEIQVPDQTAAYRIVSRQDIHALTTQPDEGGLLHGSVEIANTADFWGTSRFLIAVQS